MDTTYQEFKDLVVKERGSKLKGEHQDLLNGDIWLG